MPSANWSGSPTLVSTAASFTAPLRAAVVSVFASSGAMTLASKPKLSSSKTKLNKAGDDGERGNGDHGNDGAGK